MDHEFIAIYRELIWFIGLPKIDLLKARRDGNRGKKEVGGRLDENRVKVETLRSI